MTESVFQFEMEAAFVINPYTATENNSWDLVTNQAKTRGVNESADNGVIDMRAYAPSLTNTEIFGWQARSQTVFVRANSLNYDNLSPNQVDEAFALGPQINLVLNNELEEGDIYIARLRNTNQYAVIKITNVNGNTGNSATRYRIFFTYKKTSVNAGLD
jgi:hypothetical protein